MAMTTIAAAVGAEKDAARRAPSLPSAVSAVSAVSEPAPPTVTPILEFADSVWDENGPTRGVENLLEGGAVLAFPKLSFPLLADERRFLDPRWADPRAKNISLRWPGAGTGTGTDTGTGTGTGTSTSTSTGARSGPGTQLPAQARAPTGEPPTAEMRGAIGDPADLAALRSMIERYAAQSEAFALRLFPHYRGRMRRGNTSFRPVDVAGRETSWRKDDTRLHVDAFPSNPMRGTRLLRVFCNVNPAGLARHWRVGEPFEAHARRYLPSIRPPLPGSAWLLAAAGITKRQRSEYDHLMLRLHDLAKADAEFQRASPQAAVDFAPGTTWVVYSDQVLHAAMGGQHMLEQTFYLGPEDLLAPARSPLGTLERLLGRRLA